MLSSFLYEKTSAPTAGYKKEYSLNGQEEGFFILCRDGKTYAKIVLEKTNTNDIIPEGEDFGKFFSYLYQANGSRDLSFPKTDINLKNFLIDFRWR